MSQSFANHVGYLVRRDVMEWMGNEVPVPRKSTPIQ